MKIIYVNTGNSANDFYYTDRFQSYRKYVSTKDYTQDDNLLIVGRYKLIENFPGSVCWLITDEDLIDISNIQEYDKVDHFVGTRNTILINRYGEDFVHQDSDPVFSFRTSAPVYITKDTTKDLILSIFKKTIYLVQAKNEMKVINDLWSGKSLVSITPINNRNTTTWNLVQEHILYQILGDPQELFRTDLFVNYQNKNFYVFLYDLITQLYTSYKIKVVNPNLNLMNVNFQNVHRSGWQYIINGLSSIQPEEPVIIDTYIDKTFGWSQAFYEQNSIVPYKSRWFGFLHHTDSQDSQFYNIDKLISNKQFQKSLPFCEGIIVFSAHLRDKVSEVFRIKGISCSLIPNIFVCPYPTYLDVPQFSIDKFVANDKPLLVQIGTWLRNLFSIYRLELDPSSKIKKAVIEPVNFSAIEQGPDFSGMKTICRGNDDILADISSYLSQKEKEVSVLYRLSNQEYDSLLEKNIVFLDLKDASAVNVLVECVVRSTPILINPLPAVVEFLGKDYPFYYQSFYEASQKATDIFAITKAHEYLKNLDLNRYQLSNLIKQIETILIKP